MIDRVISLRQKLREKSPLVHCMVGAVSANDCANILLAAGAKPIMAGHPGEAAEITAGADALVLNLAGITTERMEAMLLSSHEASSRGIPVLVDLVGVACSALRREFAEELIRRCGPAVIKGNRSEIAAFREKRGLSRGVDARSSDLAADTAELERTAGELAKAYGAVILMSGPADVIAYPEGAVICRNGHSMLGELTGTGCMLGVLTGAFLAVGTPTNAGSAAVLLEGIAGELAAETARGIGSFRAELFDAVYRMTGDELRRRAKLSMLSPPLAGKA